MTPQPESRIVTAVLQTIRGRGGTAVKTHPAGGTAGTPDVLGAYHGRALALEVKHPDRRATVSLLQRHRLSQWAAAGATAAVVCSAQDTTTLLDQIDQKPIR